MFYLVFYWTPFTPKALQESIYYNHNDTLLYRTGGLFMLPIISTSNAEQYPWSWKDLFIPKDASAGEMFENTVGVEIMIHLQNIHFFHLPIMIVS